MKTKKKPAKKQPVTNSRGDVIGAIRKPRTLRRTTTDGRFGDGSKAAEALARRVVKLFGGIFTTEYQAELVEKIKAELLAAVTVTERQAEVLWEGWARPSLLVETTLCVRAQKQLPEDVYVNVIAAKPPKAVALIARPLRVAKKKAGG